MIIKLLITLLVIVGCFLYLKHRGRATNQSVSQQKSAGPQSESLPIRLIATVLVTVSVLASVAFIGYQWMDGHTLLNVRVVTPGSGSEVVYQVYKSDLGDRSFTTVDGQTVRIAGSERMEISRAE